MPTNRAFSPSTLAALGLLLLGCGSTAEDDYDGSPSGGTSATAQGGGGQGGNGAGGRGTAGSAAGSGGATAGGTASGGGPSGGSAGSASGGLAGDSRGGAGTGGSAGLAGASSGTSGMDAGMGGLGGVPVGGSGDGGRSMGGRAGTGMGGRVAMGGSAGLSSGGMSGMSAAGSAGMGAGDCPASGHVSYTLTKKANPTADEQQAYDLITEAMDKAVEYYNCYTNITKATTVTYVPSVDTADGSSNGSIRFGGKEYMEYITAMHEIAHTVGIGTVSQWAPHVVNGIFDGEQATAKLRELTGIADDQVHADSQHFWPYGLNYTSEVKSEADVINHCYIVVAIRADMGLN